MISKKKRTDRQIARMEAHKYFDPLWQSGLMSRGRAYRIFLGKRHISTLSEKNCHLLIDRLRKRYPHLYGEDV